MIALIKSRVRPHTRRTKTKVVYVSAHERNLNVHILVLEAIDKVSTGEIQLKERWKDPEWQRQYYRDWMKIKEKLKDVPPDTLNRDEYYRNLKDRKRDMEIVFAKRTGKWIGFINPTKLTNKIRLNLYKEVIKVESQLSKAQVRAKPIIKKLGEITKEIDSLSLNMDNAEWKQQATQWMRFNKKRDKALEKRGRTRGRLLFLKTAEGELLYAEFKIREEMKSTAGWGSASIEDIIKYAKQYANKNL